jgi:hypothetical protein
MNQFGDVVLFYHYYQTSSLRDYSLLTFLSSSKVEAKTLGVFTVRCPLLIQYTHKKRYQTYDIIIINVSRKAGGIRELLVSLKRPKILLSSRDVF